MHAPAPQQSDIHTSLPREGTETACAPILLFVYNRPAHVKRTVEALQANYLAAESDLFVYSDAARDDTAHAAVEEVRTYVRGIRGFRSVNVTERKENWGLARNIIDGVTTQVNRFGRVIVLEDDLVTAPYFLTFMNDALETYKDEPLVGHVHACEFTQNPSLPETFLIRWTGSWGWATWARTWKHFNPDGQALLDELLARKLDYTFDFDGRYGYTRMLRRQIAGKNNSWAIRWNASLFLKGILSLNAGRSLVQNIGFDGSGTHCGNEALYGVNLCGKRLHVDRLSPAKENLAARQAMSDYYKRTNSFRSKLIRRVKQLCSLWKTK